MVSATNCLWELYHLRPRSPRAKVVALSVIGSITVLLMLLSPFQRSQQSDFWSKFPSHHEFPNHPEDAQIVLPQKSDVSANDTLPSNLEKPNPQLHVLVPTEGGYGGVCRTLTSAMIAGYPPPTLIGYKHDRQGASPWEHKIERATRVRDYLKNSRSVKEHDIVLIVDAEDTYFQLPPHVLVKRFQEILRNTNKKLRKKYGTTTVEGPNGQRETIQKYRQRVLFSADKECYPNLHFDPGCIAVPQSSLPPDVYGLKTDTAVPHNRPRWLNPGAMIGQAADLRLIYDEILRTLQQHEHRHVEYRTLTQMFGRQEVLRELDRRHSVSAVKEWFYNLIGINEVGNLTHVNVHLETGHRYEFGMGLDYGSQLFFSQHQATNDIKPIRLNNITRSTFLMRENGVPRETRFLLPKDVASLHSPFNQTRFANEQTTRPTYDADLDALPDPRQWSWFNLPLMVNPHSFSMPVLMHLNGETAHREYWWRSMWFFPVARALLRKYVRSSQGFDAAQSSLLGGQEWWDMRGGRGGLWTDDENWITISDVCEGQERDMFDDNKGLWAKERGNPEEPVYNKWGSLVYGKEKVVDGNIVDGAI